MENTKNIKISSKVSWTGR